MQTSRDRKAIPFILKNPQTNNYELTKQAEEVLKKVDKNVSIVSVAGLYRTGKSYLLNSVILDKKGIFGVGPTVNPCTKGLWLWVEPDPTSEKRSMLVIDTEGLGALDEEANHDMKIFCLAVLLSTTFIYNSVGSIDENALQTLSLVLNLVSSIDQDNTSNRPQFIWVVRDFTLQLIDDKGKTITPQQYLQMALTTTTKQHQKVSIRKTITNAFSQRDCYTLVKPLIDETKLQNLDQVPMDELRPEFVSQSIELRNKIKSTLKQFKLTYQQNQNNITGKEYVMIVQKYLAAINSGAVPNMVDTWTFIKEEKSREALEEITRSYTEKIKSKIISKIPMRRCYLDQQFKAIKAEIKALYQKMTYGQASTDPVQEFVNNLYSQAVKINAQENKIQVKNVLNKEFEPFLKKLYSQYYNNYEQFQLEITRNYRDALVEKLTDKVDDIKEQVDRYVDNKLVENFKFFEKKLREEVKTVKIVKDQLQRELNRQVSQMATIKQKERRAQQEIIFELEKRIRMFENEKEQMLEFGKTEKDLIESNINLLKKKNEELAATNDDLNREISQLHVMQNQLKEKNFMEHKENQKERALFSQKQQYMTARIKELEQKCSQLQGKVNETGGKFESEKKGLSKHYQQKIESLESQNKRVTEKLMESQQKLGKILDEAKEMSDQIHQLKQTSVNEKKKLQQRLNQAESNKKISKAEQQLRQQNQHLCSQLQKTSQKLTQITKKYKLAQQQTKNLQNNYQKEIAIHVQQIQFQQIELTDMKNRYEELKKSYQNTLDNLHDSSRNNESSLQMKMYQLTAQHQREVKSLESEYEEKIKNFKKEIQMLSRHKQEMALQISLDKKNMESKEKQWRDSTGMLHMMVKKLQQKIESSQKDHEDINKEKQSFYALRIKQLEQELQEVKQKMSLQISENTKKSQQAFSVLKHYSEIEKQQWEKRLSDEKERSQKKLKSLRDDMQKRMNQEKASLQEQISQLQSRLAHMERVFNQKLQNMQYDHDIAMQKITNQYMEQKVQLNKELALTTQRLEITKTSFERELSTKIKHYQSTIENLKASLRQEFEENLRRMTEEKEALEQKSETLRKSNRQLQQNNLVLKSESDKERAVHKEKEKSFEKKIIQIENRLQSELGIYNKTIENLNERHAAQIQKLNEQIDKLNYNVSSLQQQRDKLETEHENNINRLQAKLKVVEESKNKNKQDYEDIVNKFQCAVSHFGNQKKKMMLEKETGIKEVNEQTAEAIKQVEESHKKMQKQNEDRISRLMTENKSLKDRIVLLEVDRSNSTKKVYDDSQKQKLQRKYQRRLQQYQQLYDKQKQKSEKLKAQNRRLRMQNQSTSFIQGNSTMTYYERPSFSEISNSRLYNNQPTSNNGNGNIGNTEVKRKFTNTPASTQRRDPGEEQHSGFLRFNGGTGYKGRD